MEMKQYLEDSARTAAKVELDKSLFEGDDSKLLHQCLDIVSGGGTADLVKRALFYHDKKIAGRAANSMENLKNMSDYLEKNTVNLTADKVDALHAALGIASEAAEMMEEIINSCIENRPIDKVNFREELGDVMWYEALGLRTIDSNFEEAGEINIAKLKKRYPEKFTSSDALNRDMYGERIVLEKDDYSDEAIRIKEAGR